MSLSLTGVSVQPSVPNVAVSEGGGGGDGDGDDGSGPQAMVCVELASGNLQRNVSVRVMTISSPTSTGKSIWNGGFSIICHRCWKEILLGRERVGWGSNSIQFVHIHVICKTYLIY